MNQAHFIHTRPPCLTMKLKKNHITLKIRSEYLIHQIFDSIDMEMRIRRWY